MLTGEAAVRVQALVRQTCEEFEIRIVKMVVSEHHAQILVSAPPEMAPSEIPKRIKVRASSRLFEEFPHIKKRYLGAAHMCERYFCATAGQSREETIKLFLEHHFESGQSDIFKMEPE